MTGEEKLEFARGHDWTWCIYAGTSQDCHGRICKCIAVEEEAKQYRSKWSEAEREFWNWVIGISQEFKNHPDVLKLSLLDWCLRDPVLKEIWQRIQQEEALVRLAKARATAFKVAANGQLADSVIQAKIKEQKREAANAKKRLRYHQKRIEKVMHSLLDQPLCSISTNIELVKDSLHEDILRRHSERIQIETEQSNETKRTKN